jgi:hypothetical protein
VATLKELLGQGEKRQTLIRDACGVLDQEVADKGGLGGVAIRGAYGIVKGIKPGFITEVVDGLLDDFLDALNPLYEEALQKGQTPGTYLTANGDRVANTLLGITDARVEGSSRTVVRKTYEKLRPTAVKHVAAAAPRLGQMLDRQLS